MKPSRGVLCLSAVGCFLTFAAVPCARAESTADAPQGSSFVSVAEAKAWVDEGKSPFFLDVREKDEFDAGHLPGAVNILYTEVAGMVDQLPKDRPVVTYCIHSAHRAPEATTTLRKLGMTNAYVLEGGIVAWEAGGQTIEASGAGRSARILPLGERCLFKKPET